MIIYADDTTLYSTLDIFGTLTTIETRGPGTLTFVNSIAKNQL